MSSIELYSEHPIAKGIVHHSESLNLTLESVSNFQAIPGKGVKGNLGAQEVLAVSPSYFKELGHNIDDSHQKDIDTYQQQGKTVILVIVDVVQSKYQKTFK